MRVFWKTHGHAVLLVLILLLGLGLRCSLRYGHDFLFFGDPQTGLPQSDANTWSIHARNLVEGRGFGDYLKGFRCYNYVPPGHPFLLGALHFFLGKDLLWVGAAMGILSSLLPLLAYLLVREMWGRGPALLAALFAAIHAPFITVSFSVMSEPTAILTMALAVWMWARLMRVRTPGWAIVAGLCLGLSALVRPTTFACASAMSPWLLFGREFKRRRRWVVLALYLLAFLVPPVAWQVRNRAVHGEPAAIYSSISARHLWTGANAEYRPWFYSRKAWHEALWRDPHATELQRIRGLQEEARRWIRGEPVRYAFGCLWRMRLLRWENEKDRLKIPWTYGGRSYVRTSLLCLLGVLGFLLSFVCVTRASGSRTEHSIPGFVWSAAFGMTFMLMIMGAGIYGASERYRWPLEFLLVPFAALGLYALGGIGKKDAMVRHVFHVTPGPVWAGRLGRIAGCALVALLLVYSGGLVHARARSATAPLSVREVDVADVHRLMQHHGLADELAGQEPQWLTYDAVRARQEANFGRVTEEDNDRIVAWSGRVLYPHWTVEGFQKGYLIVNARADDFGGARLLITPHDPSAASLGVLQERATVTVIGRIAYRGGWTRRPDLKIYGALPGKFDPSTLRER